MSPEPKPEDTRRPTVDDDDVRHRWCCNESIAICGEDLTVGDVMQPGTGIPCPLCETAVVERALCPVRGCRLRRLLHLGPWRKGGA